MSKYAAITNFFRPTPRVSSQDCPSNDSSSAAEDESHRVSSLSKPTKGRQTENTVQIRHTISTLPSSIIQLSSDATSGLSSPPAPSSQQSLPDQTSVTEANRKDPSITSQSSSDINDDSSPRAKNETSLPTPKSAAKDSPRRSGADLPRGNASNPKDSGSAASQSMLTSSQRIVKNGEVMIRNSDDETDSADQSDSEDSLRGFDAMLEAQKQALEPAQDDLQNTNEQVDRVRRPKRKFQGTMPNYKVSHGFRDDSPVPPKKYKYSLKILAERRKEDEESSAAIDRAKHMVESFDQQQASTEKKCAIDTSILDSVLKGHVAENNVDRLKAAIERTEAFDHGKAWSFFGDNADDIEAEPFVFPQVEDEQIKRLFTDESTQQQSFLSGFVGDIAVKRRLPEEILLWIMSSICSEPRDDLNHAYICTLKDAIDQITPLLAPSHIDVLFRKVGATATAVSINATVVPYTIRSQSAETKSRPRLLSLLKLLSCLANAVDSESRIHILNTLCRLTLDHSVIQDIHTASAIEEVFASLIESMSETHVQHEVSCLRETSKNLLNLPF